MKNLNIVVLLHFLVFLGVESLSAAPDVFMLKGVFSGEPPGLVVVDSETHAVVDTISTTPYQAFGVHPDGELIYALRTQDNEIDVIDIASKQVIKTIATGVDAPAELVFDIERRRAYVAGTMLEVIVALSIIDIDSHEEIDVSLVSMLADGEFSAREIEMAISESNNTLLILKHGFVASSTSAFVQRNLINEQDFDLLPGGESLQEALVVRPQNGKALWNERVSDDCYWSDGGINHDTLGIVGCPGIAMSHDGARLFIPHRTFNSEGMNVHVIDYHAKQYVEGFNIGAATSMDGIAHHPRADVLYVAAAGFFEETYVVNPQSGNPLNTLDFTAYDIEFLPGCGDGLPGFGEECDDSNTRSGDGCSARCRIEDGWKCSEPRSALVVDNQVLDPGFEAGSPSAVWTASGEQAICALATCGDLGSGVPYSGSWYLRIGGDDDNSFSATVSQDLVIPEGSDVLTYQYRTTSCPLLNEHELEIRLDGQLLRNYNVLNCSLGPYRLESVDISGFADGQLHTLTISGSTSPFVLFGNSKYSYLDDFRLGPAAPSLCTTEQNILSACDTQGGPLPYVPPVGVLVEDRVVVDLDVELDLQHSAIDEVEVSLVRPGGLQTKLFSQPNCAGEDMRVIFDDEADRLIDYSCNAGIAAFSFQIKPENPLYEADQESPNGVTVNVVDTVAGGGSGSVNEFCLHVALSGCQRAPDAPTLLIQNSVVPDQNVRRFDSWLADIGIEQGSIEHTVDFETGFVEGQGISGGAGLFPGGLVITDTSAGAAFVSGLPFNLGDSNPVGSLALSSPEAPLLELDFSDSPVDYVAFDSIDHLGVMGNVFFENGDSSCIEFEATDSNGDSAEFFGLYRGDNAPITRVELTPVSDDGKWGIDNLRYGVVADDDADGIANNVDNCTGVANPAQRDTDGDDIGNFCDPDVDGGPNCLVNFLDLNVYRANFFMAGDLDTDNNGDNITNFLDLNIVRDFFFLPPGPSANGCN